MNQRRVSSPSDQRLDLSGSLLLTHPLYSNERFEERVILVLESNEKGHLGVVLNEPADARTIEAWEKLTGERFAVESLVWGGPQGGPVIAIQAVDQPAHESIEQGLYVATDSDAFDSLADVPPENYRIVFGVMTWPAGQLEREISEGRWCEVAVERDEIFGEATEMWGRLFRRYGAEVFSEVVGIESFLKSPEVN